MISQVRSKKLPFIKPLRSYPAGRRSAYVPTFALLERLKK